MADREALRYLESQLGPFGQFRPLPPARPYILALPEELLIKIFEIVAEDARLWLKNCRYMNRTWRRCGAVVLFDKLVISPQNLNIETFNFITSHQVFSHYVKHLVYDGTWFRSNFGNLNYKQQLVHDDKESAKWENFRVTPKRISFKLLEVKEGERTYLQHAETQMHHLRSKAYVKTLVQGLRKLPQLRQVSFTTFWDFGCCERYIRGPGAVCRKWHQFHLLPKGQESLSDGSRNNLQLMILTSALYKAERQIKDFSIMEGEPDGGFDLPTADFGGEKFTYHLLKGLTHLDLSPGWNSAHNNGSEECVNRTWFLGNTPNLQFLVLDRWTFPTGTGLKHRKWPHLRSFCFVNSATTESELLIFLRAHAATLRHVCFAAGAFFGKWATVLDVLRDELRLESFSFPTLPNQYVKGEDGSRVHYELVCGRLSGPKGNVVNEDTLQDANAKMQECVLRGGKNPLSDPNLLIFCPRTGKVEPGGRLLRLPPAEPW